MTGKPPHPPQQVRVSRVVLLGGRHGTRILNEGSSVLGGGEVEECRWANKERGDNSSACLSLRFLRKDRLGHVLAEVYMELDDGGEFNDHNCCFYINTEYGLLQRFRDQLPKLKQPELFSVVRLNERL